MSRNPKLPLEAMEVNPSLTFFRCQVVENWPQLKDIRNQLIDDEIEKYDGASKISRMEAVENRRCPPGNTTAPCPNIHAIMDVLRATYPDTNKFNTSLIRIRALFKDAKDLKDAKGWQDTIISDE